MLNKLFQKKLGVLVLLGASAVAFTQQANAQVPISWNLKVGVGYGNQAATISTVAIDSAYKLGFLGGAGIVFGAGPVGIGIDALYAIRNFDSAGTATTKVSRLEIPVVARFSTGMLAFSAGGYWAMNMGTPQVTVGAAAAVDATNTASSDYGLIAGIGFGMPIPIGSFTLDLRYNFGLANQIDVPTGTDSVKLRSFDLIAGIGF